MKRFLSALMLTLMLTAFAVQQDYPVRSYSDVYRCLVVDGGQIVRVGGEYFCVFNDAPGPWSGPAETK